MFAIIFVYKLNQDNQLDIFPFHLKQCVRKIQIPSVIGAYVEILQVNLQDLDVLNSENHKYNFK